MIRRHILLALLTVFCQFGLHAQEQTAEQKTDKVVHILAIGNSFSDDAVVQYLYELAHEAGQEVIIGNAYRGGQGLQSHWIDVTEQHNTFEYRKIVNGQYHNTPNSALSTIVTDEPWDFISFQQVSQESGLKGTIEPYMTYLEDYTRSLATNPQARYGYHMTWAYAHDTTHGGFANYGNSQAAMYDSIVSTVRYVMEKHPELQFMAPSGTAIQNARTTYIGDNMNRDGYHLDYKFGRYTAACVWLETILGINPVGLKFRPDGVDELTAHICQLAAHNACRNPYAVTDMAGEGFHAINDIKPSGLIKLNFGGKATSDKSWNNILPACRTYNWITDAKENVTGITITCNDPFNGVNANGPTYTTTRMLMPAEVSESCVWGYAAGSFDNTGTQPTGGYRLGHLNPSLSYDFTIFSSRKDCKDVRQTSFMLQGQEAYAGNLNASDNTQEALVIKNVRPSHDGIISIIAMPGLHNNNVNKFYYLNAITIKAH